MNHQSITIVIPNYNSSLLSIRCLDSVFTQVGDHNLEVIVIDDGSTDNSVEVVRSQKYNLSSDLQTNLFKLHPKKKTSLLTKIKNFFKN